MKKFLEKIKWIYRNYGSTYRQRKFHDYDSREIAREYSHKWANRSGLCVKLVIKAILLLRIDYLIVK